MREKNHYTNEDSLFSVKLTFPIIIIIIIIIIISLPSGVSAVCFSNAATPSKAISPPRFSAFTDRPFFQSSE